MSRTEHGFRWERALARRPSGIDERPEQLRHPVAKADGSTESERYLAKLAERSFLNLWSYPSPYRDQKRRGIGDGKELCDLLVVCGVHVIIFSEKTIDWPSGDIATAWRRWATRAIRDSAKQTKGAERWISDFPERVFLDRECKIPFPIDLPPIETRQVHRVVVANGSASACREHLHGSIGSLIVRPSVVGDSHWAAQHAEVEPFVVGDIDPNGSFVHVFNEAALDIVMAELDTIRDFTDYLAKKAAFIRSGELIEAHGEENLLAYYAVRINDEGDHDFVAEDKKGPFSIDNLQYRSFVSNPRYLAKKRADEISYLWDRFIELFTDHLLGGTSITLEGYEFDLRKSELGVRLMALVPRLIRRSHSEAIAGALEKGKNSDKFARVMISPTGAKANQVAFIVLTVKYLDWMENRGGYEKYRAKRSELAQIYAQGLLERHSHLKHVVGIALEPPGQDGGTSEDMLCAMQCDWTDQERETIQKACKEASILQNVKESRHQGGEFPDVETVVIEIPVEQSHTSNLNRKQRRALRARTRNPR